MADWSTVAIALVSAGAALSGVYLKTRHEERTSRRGASRADLASLRMRLEELLLEIDRVNDLMNERYTTYLLSIVRKEPMGQIDERFSLSKIRALVALHFPECQPALDEFDQRDARISNYFTEQMAKQADLETTGILASQRRTESVNKLAEDLRKRLATTVGSVGLTASHIQHC